MKEDAEDSSSDLGPTAPSIAPISLNVDVELGYR